MKKSTEMKKNLLAFFSRGVGVCAAVLVAATALQGCGNGTLNKSTENVTSTSSAVWPQPQTAWLPEGAFPNIENLRKLGAGMTKDQIRGLLGVPHFDEGPFGVKVWNYLFNFRTGKGNEYVTCQYQVRFVDGLSSVLSWKDDACAKFLRPETLEPARVEAPVLVERFRLSADALFGFDKSGLADLLPEGRRQLEAIASQIVSRKQQIDKVTIVGFADRLGSERHNQAPSLSRANAVRDFLVSRGIEPGLVRVSGAGADRPVVQCPGERATPELLTCLQPNRRVEIEVTSAR